MPDETMPFNVYVVRVRSHQTDLNAALYHAAYFDIFDDARIETFRRLAYTYERMLAGRWTVVIRSVQCEYSTPAFMDDLLTVTVWVERLTKATMTLRYDCRRDGQRIALGVNVYVFVDSTRRPIQVPADLRTVIEANSDTLMWPASD